jgi:pimeloyl-ACP methyl ester carboxylesterase
MLLENAHTIPMDWNAPPPTPLTCEELGTINAPTLIVTGAETHPAWTAMGKTIAGCIPGAEHVVLDGVGHGGPLAARDAFLALTLEFIDSH